MLKIDLELKLIGSSLFVFKGKPEVIIENLIISYKITSVYCKADFEPYSINRDEKVKSLLIKYNINFYSYTDHLLLEPYNNLKSDNKPYTIFTPFKNQFLKKLNISNLKNYDFILKKDLFIQENCKFPLLEEIGFTKSSIKPNEFDLT